MTVEGGVETIRSSYVTTKRLPRPCFAQDTPILMGDGSFKPARAIKVGSFVMGFSEPMIGLKRFLSGSVMVTKVHSFKEEMWVVILKGLSLNIAPTTKIVTANGWSTVRQAVEEKIPTRFYTRSITGYDALKLVESREYESDAFAFNTESETVIVKNLAVYADG